MSKNARLDAAIEDLKTRRESIETKLKILRDARALTRSDEWDESQHPRAEDGKFGEGSGGGSRESRANKAEAGISGRPVRESKPEPMRPAKVERLKEIGERLGKSFQDTDKNVPAKDDYVAKAMQNLKNTSRTAAGKIDLTASPDKAKAMASITGAEAKDKAIENYQNVIERLHEQRARTFKSPDDLRKFVEGVAADVNKGIVKDDALIRQHDSDKYPYTKVADLDGYMKDYYKELYAKMDDPKVDPKDLAAWSEWKLDLEGHFFSDGVGKTSKAISSYLMMRRGHDLPTWPTDRKKIFDNARDGLKGWTKFYRSMYDGGKRKDAEWNEEEHPRDENGRFGAGGGGGKSVAPKVGPLEHTEGSKAYKETPEERAHIAKALKMSNDLAAEWQDKLKEHGVTVKMGGSLVSDLALPSDAYDADLKFLYDGPNSKDLIPHIEKATGLKYVKTVNMGGGGHDKVVDAHMIEGFLTKDDVTLEVEGALRDGKNYTGWHQHYKDVLTPEELHTVRARKWELTQTPEGRVSKAYKAYKGEVRDEVQRRMKEKGLLRKDYDEDQPRDESGRWTEGGGAGGGGGDKRPTAALASSGGNRSTPDEHAKRVERETTAAKLSEPPKKSKPVPKEGWRGEAGEKGHKETVYAFKRADGTWREDRQKFHKAYIDHILDTKAPKSSAPTVYMTGGGPATGKTVGILKNPAAGIPDKDKAVHVNPDDSKEFLPEYKNGKGDEEAAGFVHEESSDMAKEAQKAALAAGHDVVLDTVGDSGIDKLHDKVEKMRKQGAKFIKADYGTVNVDEAWRRAKQRADEEGRFVKEDVVRAAHKDVAKTAVAAMERGTFDEMGFWDTSAPAGTTPTKIATYTRDKGLVVHDKDAWEAFKRRGEGHP